VDPVVAGARFCDSKVLIDVPSRPLGAGLGTGTVCAEESVAAPMTDTTSITVSAVRVPAAERDWFRRDV
jgi:hypothetical protein